MFVANNNDSLTHIHDTHCCRSAIDLARQSLDAPVRTETFSPRLMEVCCYIFCLLEGALFSSQVAVLT